MDITKPGNMDITKPENMDITKPGNMDITKPGNMDITKLYGLHFIMNGVRTPKTILNPTTMLSRPRRPINERCLIIHERYSNKIIIVVTH
jgi:hypothetical protein